MKKLVVIADTYQSSDYSTNWAGSNPILETGQIGFEIDTGFFKIGRNGLHWNSIPYAAAGGPGTGTVTSVGITQPAKGITVSGSPVTGAGSITLALADDLAAVESLNTTGPVKRTGANAWGTGPINLATEVTGVLPGANGGAGAISITAGTNVTVTGTAPNYIINSSATSAGTVTSVNITQPAAGIKATGGPITGSGSITLALGDDLAAVEALGGLGFARRTALNTWTTTSAIDLAADTLGTLPVANGGTGTSSPGIVAGTNVTVTGSWPNQTINSTGGGGGGGSSAPSLINSYVFGG